MIKITSIAVGYIDDFPLERTPQKTKHLTGISMIAFGVDAVLIVPPVIPFF